MQDRESCINLSGFGIENIRDGMVKVNIEVFNNDSGAGIICTPEVPLSRELIHAVEDRDSAFFYDVDEGGFRYLGEFYGPPIDLMEIGEVLESLIDEIMSCYSNGDGSSDNKHHLRMQ